MARKASKYTYGRNAPPEMPKVSVSPGREAPKFCGKVGVPRTRGAWDAGCEPAPKGQA